MVHTGHGEYRVWGTGHGAQGMVHIRAWCTKNIAHTGHGAQGMVHSTKCAAHSTRYTHTPSGDVPDPKPMMSSLQPGLCMLHRLAICRFPHAIALAQTPCKTPAPQLSPSSGLCCCCSSSTVGAPHQPWGRTVSSSAWWLGAAAPQQGLTAGYPGTGCWSTHSLTCPEIKRS